MAFNPRCGRTLVWYALSCVLMAAAYPFVPPGGRLVASLAVPGLTLVVACIALARVGAPGRRPWTLLVIGLVMLQLGNIAQAYYIHVEHRVNSDGLLPGSILFPLGFAFMLATALVVVVQRGRNDFGGLVDAAIAGAAAGGFTWDLVLLPHFTATHASVAFQAPIFLDIFFLTGVLGALARVWFLATEPLPSLKLFVLSLVLTLVSNIVLAVSTFPVARPHPAWLDALFLLAYVPLGAAALHPSAKAMTSRGAAPRDSLSGRRLVFLGIAMILQPVIGGGRALLGYPIDGLLLALGTIMVVPLVMVRIGRLSAARERAETALTYQATHDALTDLPNRRAFLERLQIAMDGFRVGTTPGVTVLFCDLDGFKAVNDTLGHAVGDKLLAGVAIRLARCVRDTDVVSRFGGDEFLVLCQSRETSPVISMVMDRIRDEMSRPFVIDSNIVPIGISVGSVVAHPTIEVDELIRRADEAMYAAKQRSRELRAGRQSA